jgi:peptide chain release factor 3
MGELTIQQEINKRKTFAIISHPDAGKTTLTEKLLLFGGAIQTAGAVKSNKIKKTATSDFMEIEKQRGISVATSVMTFEYCDHLINILDTPGHKDFAEDTFRTLTAVDSVILVIDSVKGVEEQTERLMEVCRMRDTPVIVFVNKMDREGRDVFELLDELEEKLSIHVRPMSWPIGAGQRFQGVYKIYDRSFRFTAAAKTSIGKEVATLSDLQDPELDQLIGSQAAQVLREETELIEGVYEPFKKEDYLSGHLAPVFFGSALNSFGIKEMLDTFVEIAPRPQQRESTIGHIVPEDKDFSGFIFKIHANLDPRHRDRIAFLRIVSGRFDRNTFYYHPRLQKQLKFSNPVSFMAENKQLVETAYPGDVVGLYDTGLFKIGDAVTSGKSLYFKGIPSFSPEIFKELINLDPMKSKQLEKGIEQLTDEGVAQLFRQEPGNRKFIGTVGELQFEVILYRLEHEYGAKCRFEARPFYKACWMTGDSDKIKEFIKYKQKNVVKDKDGNLVFLAETAWVLNAAKQQNPDIEFHLTSDFKLNIS